MQPSLSPRYAHNVPGEAADQGLAVSQEEANAIATNLDLPGIDHIHVHWIAGVGGKPQALLHPVRRCPGDWVN